MKYKTILADPPWPFADARSRPWAGKGGRRGRDSFFPYEMMSLEAIKSLDVKGLAMSDSHLYLWIPSSMNRHGVGCEVIKAWGYDEVSEIVWKKKNFGLGKFPRPQHEILLIARTGSLPFQLNNVGSVQTWSQPRAHNNGGRIHSAKPDGAIDLIERASPGPYLELFARRKRMGWDTWGDQIWKDVELASL